MCKVLDVSCKRGMFMYLFVSVIVVGLVLYIHVYGERVYEFGGSGVESQSLGLEEELCLVGLELLNLDKELQSLKLQLSSLEKEYQHIELRLNNIIEIYDLSLGVGSVRSRCEFAPEVYEKAWEELGADGLKGTGSAFYQAECDYGVNGLFLAAVAFHESAGGSSEMAVKKNNLFGLNAVDDAPHLAFTFKSKGESVDYVASLLSHDYLSRGGRYYNGETPVAISKCYASDPLWSEKVCATMQQILRVLIEGWAN